MYRDNLINLRKFGYKILVSDSSHYVSMTGINLKDVCDYYQYDRDNRRFDADNLRGGAILYNRHFDGGCSLHYFCNFDNAYELNIHYCNSKAFNFALSENYDYVLKMEADIAIDDDGISKLKSDIESFVASGKKILMTASFDTLIEGVYGVSATIFCSETRWYLDHYGNIRTNDDWRTFLSERNYPCKSLEDVFAMVVRDNIDQATHWDISNIRMRFCKSTRYVETRRYHGSDIYLDFFNNDDKTVTFLASTNPELCKYPHVRLIQNLKDGRKLYNDFGDPSGSLTWIIIDRNIESVELTVNDLTTKMSAEHVFATPHVIKL